MHNGLPYVHPTQPVIDVAPLNSVPYFGPPLVPIDPPFSAMKKNHDGPAMVLLPCCPTEEDARNMLYSLTGGVILTGSAVLGKIGPLIGSLDVGESEDEYFFRVSLPGVSADESVDRFSWEIEPNGKVIIKGVTTTGEGIVRKFSQVFMMQTQNLCPPGKFSVSFTLPGPVEFQTVSASFFLEGIFVGKIKKKGRIDPVS